MMIADRTQKYFWVNQLKVYHALGPLNDSDRFGIDEDMIEPKETMTERNRKTQKKFYYAHREEILAARKEYYKKNKEKLECSEEVRKKNIAYQKEYYRKNKERLKYQAKKRRKLAKADKYGNIKLQAS